MRNENGGGGRTDVAQRPPDSWDANGRQLLQPMAGQVPDTVTVEKKRASSHISVQSPP
jgi:hypothetical protein